MLKDQARPTSEKAPHFTAPTATLACLLYQAARKLLIFHSRTCSCLQVLPCGEQLLIMPLTHFQLLRYIGHHPFGSFKAAANAAPRKLNKKEESVGGIDLINFPQRRLHIIRFPTSVLVTPSHHSPIIQDCRIRGM